MDLILTAGTFRFDPPPPSLLLKSSFPILPHRHTPASGFVTRLKRSGRNKALLFLSFPKKNMPRLETRRAVPADRVKSTALLRYSERTALPWDISLKA